MPLAGIGKVRHMQSRNEDMRYALRMERLTARKIEQTRVKQDRLGVRVTGFTAYFNSLSPAFRQLVVKRLIREVERDNQKGG